MVLDIFKGVINSLQIYFESDEQYQLTKRSHVVGHAGILSHVTQRWYPWQNRFSISALGEQRDPSLFSLKLWSSQEIPEFDHLKIKNFILRNIDYDLYSSFVLQLSMSMQIMKYYPKVGLGMYFNTKIIGHSHGKLCPTNPDDMFIIQNMYDRGKALSTDVKYFKISGKYSTCN